MIVVQDKIKTYECNVLIPSSHLKRKMKRPDNTSYKFLISGHIHMEADTIYAAIEKQKKKDYDGH